MAVVKNSNVSGREYAKVKTNPVTGGSVISAGDASLNVGAWSVKCALGVLGQSNELGGTMEKDALGAYQRASASAPSQGIYEPVKMAPAGYGSMFTAVAEMLAKDCIKVDLYNGSLGSASIPKDFCGFVYMGGRTNGTAYRGKRSSIGAGDPGTRGDLVFENGNTWECTTGNRWLAFLNSTTPVSFGGANYYSDVTAVIKETTVLTHATVKPTFPASPTVGTTTVVDGGITWTCIANGTPVTDGDGIHVMRYTEDGFDPYYAIDRLAKAVLSSAVSPKKRFVYVQNGQSDAGMSGVPYKIGLREVVKSLSVTYGLIPIVGLSIFYPAQTQAQWDVLETQISGGGLGSSPDFANSPLTSTLTSAGVNRATPGSALPTYPYYYGKSLYRAFGTDTLSMLQDSSPHVVMKGMYACAMAIAPTLATIMRNSAT